MGKVKVEYQGLVRTVIHHCASGSQANTDVPMQEGASPSAFTPVELLCGAVGSCMISLIGVAGQTHGFPTEGISVEVDQTIAEDPLRVGSITCTVDLRIAKLNEKQKKIVERTARTCPVVNSLREDIEVKVDFIYS